MPDQTPKEHASKPGYKTTEFWLSTLVTLLGIVLASGAFEATGLVGQIVGGALSVLAALGYTSSRTAVKKQEANSDK